MTQPAICLVTGCAGFVGSHLCDALLEAGHRVIGVDDLSLGLEDNLAGCVSSDAFTMIRCDISEPDWFDSMVDQVGAPTHIFHLAAMSGVEMVANEPDRAWKINLDATLRLHEKAQELGAVFVFAGSAAEYGNATPPLDESAANDETEHISIYGRSKYLGSKAIADSGHGCSLRFFNIFGPRQNPASPYTGVISAFMFKALSGSPLTIHGKGNQTRDFLYIADSIKAYMLAAGLVSGSMPLTGVYNVGTGRATSILDIAEAISKLVGDTGITHQPTREGDILHSRADVSAITRAGFKAEISLEDGLEATIAWQREQAKA